MCQSCMCAASKIRRGLQPGFASWVPWEFTRKAERMEAGGCHTGTWWHIKQLFCCWVTRSHSLGPLITQGHQQHCPCTPSVTASASSVGSDRHINFGVFFIVISNIRSQCQLDLKMIGKMSCSHRDLNERVIGTWKKESETRYCSINKSHQISR